MIAAVDNFGNSYVSLTQRNTNSKTFADFLRQLASLLDSENQHWKTSSYIVLDNATYHKSQDVIKSLH